MKTYLGDSVYVDLDRGMVRLTTEDGVEVTNTIFLEPAVYEALLKWVESLKKAVGSEITTKDGILFRNGEELDVTQADELARSRGYVYAEDLVAAMEKEKLA